MAELKSGNNPGQSTTARIKMYSDALSLCNSGSEKIDQKILIAKQISMVGILQNEINSNDLNENGYDSFIYSNVPDWWTGSELDWYEHVMVYGFSKHYNLC